MAKQKQDEKSKAQDPKPPEPTKLVPMVEALGMARGPTGYLVFRVEVPADHPGIEVFNGKVRGSPHGLPYKNARALLDSKASAMFLPVNVDRRRQ